MENVVRFRDVNDGSELQLSLNDGRVFDLKGNQVARWSPAQSEDEALLADYANDYSVTMAAGAIHHADPGRAAMLLKSRVSESGGDDDPVLMDLAVSEVHIPTGNQTFASGYKNFQPLADAVLPPVPVTKQSDKYWQFAKEDAFQRAMPTIGAAGAAVAEIAPRISNATYSTIERALGGFVSTQLASGADAPLKIEQAHVRRCVNALLIEREIRAAGLMRTTANWNAAQVTTIAAGTQWNGGASSDPVKDLHTLIEASYGDVTGIIMPEPIAHAFQRSPAVRSYHAYKSTTDALPTPDKLSAILGLPPIYVARMKYINSAGALAYIWGTDIIVFRQPDEMPPTSQEDVATGYTFRWNVADLKDGQSNGGWIVRQFFSPERGSMGGMRIVVVHNDAEVITSKFIGGILVSAYQ